jgi:tetratricopeptide (TPR) repeat protein
MLVRSRLYTGELQAAEQIAREHVAAVERLAASRPDNASLRRDLMNSYVEMGYVYWHPGFLNLDDPEMSATFHAKALAIARELAAHDPSNATAQFDLAITESDLCDALNQRRPADALGHCKEALRIADQWPSQFVPATALTYYADSLARLGHTREALDPLNRSIAICEKIMASDPSNFNRHQNLVRAHNQMGALLQDLGDRAGALDHRRTALKLAEEIAARRPDNLIARRDLADTYAGLARYYVCEDRRTASDWSSKSQASWPSTQPRRHDEALSQTCPESSGNAGKISR